MSTKTATRHRLQEQALRLFSERGFDEVTVEEVARAAGVSHMTFFRHFPTKESVVLDDPYDPLLGVAVSTQDQSLPPLERARRGLFDAWQSLDEPDDGMTRRRIELAASHPSLRARVWENNLKTEKVIVEALIAGGADPLDAVIAAGAVLGAVTAALFHWAEQPGESSLGDRMRHAVALLGPEWRA